jgi:UDPglucose 6-dehydrogenase
MNKKITIFGAGYVGFSLAVLLSSKHHVCLLDPNQKKISMINNQKSPIDDTDIQNYIDKNDLDLIASSDFENIGNNSDFYIIATPTDFNEYRNTFDISSVENCINSVIKTGTKSLIIIKSTVPIGFTEQMNKKFFTDQIIFSPEFLREGHALHDNLHPSRIIAGGNSSQIDTFTSLLKNIALEKNTESLTMRSDEAEAVKLFSNSYLALRVSFFNELDTYALENNLNTEDIIKGVSLDARIGSGYNNPSFGYGGYCLPKDSKQLLSNYGNIPQDLIQSVIKSNITRKRFLSDKIISLAPNVVGIFRLSMKKGSENFKSSAILEIIKNLEKNKIKIIIYEPIQNFDQERWEFISSLEEFKLKSDIILANRYSDELDDVKDKVFTRDIFEEN